MSIILPIARESLAVPHSTDDRNNPEPALNYDAFISYSHRDDRDVARSLERTLWTFGRSWYQIRGLRTYRDETNLAAEPDLWPAIERSIKQSRTLVLLASPAAARSRWVPREVATAIQAHGPRSLCIVQTGGVLPWTDDVALDDFLSRQDRALDEATWRLLTERAMEPLVVDLRPFRDVPERNRNKDAEYLSRVASIAAHSLRKSKDALWGQYVRGQRLRMAFLGATSLILLSLAIALGFAMHLEHQATVRAEDRTRESLMSLARSKTSEFAARALSAQQRPDLAIALALHSLHAMKGYQATTVEGEQALRAALASSHGERVFCQPEPSGLYSDETASFDVSPAGDLFAVGTSAGVLCIYRRAEGRLALLDMLQSFGGSTVAEVRFSSSGKWLFTLTSDGYLRSLDLESTVLNPSRRKFFENNHSFDRVGSHDRVSFSGVTFDGDDQILRIWTNGPGSSGCASALHLAPREGADARPMWIDMSSVRKERRAMVDPQPLEIDKAKGSEVRAVAPDATWTITRDANARAQVFKRTASEGTSQRPEEATAAFSPGGEWLVLADKSERGDELRVYVWKRGQLSTPYHSWRLAGYPGEPAISFDKSGQTAVIGPKGLEIDLSVPPTEVHALLLKLSPDNVAAQEIAVPLERRPGSSFEPVDFEFDPAGQWLASGPMGSLWRTQDGTLVFASKEPAYPIFSNNSSWLALVGSETRLLRLGADSVDDRGIVGPPGDATFSQGSDALLILTNGLITEHSLETDRLIAKAARYLGRNLKFEDWQRQFADEPYARLFPDLPVDVSVIDDLIVRGQQASRLGDEQTAKTAFQEATQYAVASNSVDVCRAVVEGGIGVEVPLMVLPAADYAVAILPDNVWLHDLRGRARVGAGNTAGAIEDFMFFTEKMRGSTDTWNLRLVVKHRRWIQRLNMGEKITVKELSNPEETDDLMLEWRPASSERKQGRTTPTPPHTP